jgi:hypothetical protein
MVYILYLILAKARLNLKLMLSHALYAAGAGVLGLMLAAIYLIPVIMETRYIKIEQWTSGSYNYLQHFVYFSQFLSEKWGYGYAGPGTLDDFSYQLGLVMVCLLGFGLVAIFTRRFPHRATAFFFLISTGVVILLMSPLAEPLWQVLPIASLVQFPWRLLAMSAFTMSIVAGALVASLTLEEREALPSTEVISEDGGGKLETETSQTSPPTLSPTPTVYLLSLVIILGSFAYTLPQYTEVPAWAETSLAVINWDRASIVDRVGMVSVTQTQPQTSPMEPQYLKGEPLVTAGIIAGQGQLQMVHHGGASDVVQVVAETPVTLQFYAYDYPGWQVSLDSNQIPHRFDSPYGLVTVDVPAGEHEVSLRMGSTPPRTLGTVVSGIAILVMITLILPIFSETRFLALKGPSLGKKP